MHLLGFLHRPTLFLPEITGQAAAENREGQSIHRAVTSVTSYLTFL